MYYCIIMNNNSLLNNINTKAKYNKIEKTSMANPSTTLNNLTLSIHNIKKLLNSKNKNKSNIIIV